MLRMGSRLHELSGGLGNSGALCVTASPRTFSILTGCLQFGLIATGFEKYGSQAELEKDAIKHLFDVYVQVNKDAAEDPNVKAEAAKWFRRMEDGDESALKNWRVWRELSVKKYAEEYERLNVHFDVYNGESMVGKEWQDKALERLDEMGLISDSDGAKLVDLEKWKLGKAVLRKKGAQHPLSSWIPLIVRVPLQTELPFTSPATSVVPSNDTKSINSTK